METIIFGLALVCLGFVLGWKIRELHAQTVVNNYFKAAGFDGTEKSNTYSIKIHKEHGQFYVSEAESGKFLVQISTKDELFDYINTSLKDKIVLIRPDQLALFDA